MLVEEPGPVRDRAGEGVGPDRRRNRGRGDVLDEAAGRGAAVVARREPAAVHPGAVRRRALRQRALARVHRVRRADRGRARGRRVCARRGRWRRHYSV